MIWRLPSNERKDGIIRSIASVDSDFWVHPSHIARADDHAEAAKWSGWLRSGENILSFFAMPLCGALSDVWGRKVCVSPRA